MVKYFSLENIDPDDVRNQRTIVSPPWSQEEASAFMSPFVIERWQTPTVIFEPTAEGRVDDFPIDLDGSLIVSSKAQRILNNLCEDYLQFLPVHAVDKSGDSMDIQYALMIILNKVDCLDYHRVLKWSDGFWMPDSLIIDPGRVPAGPLIYRTQGYRTVVVVDEMVKEAFEEEAVTGVKFWEIQLSTDLTAPAPEPVPEHAVAQYRTQWERLPHYKMDVD